MQHINTDNTSTHDRKSSKMTYNVIICMFFYNCIDDSMHVHQSHFCCTPSTVCNKKLTHTSAEVIKCNHVERVLAILEPNLNRKILGYKLYGFELN